MSILREKMKEFFEIYPEYFRTYKKKTKKMKKKKKGIIIPAGVLYKFYEEGIRFGPEPPERGMQLEKFLELLWRHYKALPDRKEYMSLPNREQYKSFPKELHGDAYFALYEDTVKNEFKPNFENKIIRKRH